MLVTQDFLAGLMTNYRAIFKKTLDESFAEKPLYEEISTHFPSTTDRETYGWLGSNPQMSEWLDTRQIKGLEPNDYTLINRHYEGTIGVNRDAYEDDRYGFVAPRIRGLARRAVRHFNQTVLSKLDAGATDLAYDSTAFFSNTRTIGDSANIDNLLAGSYSGDGDEIRAALAAAFVAMQEFQDDNGVPMGIMPDTIVCSPTMVIPIRTALVPAVAGTTRPEAGIFDPGRIFSSPWIDADSLDWYVLCTKEIEVRPLIFQLRKNVEFVSLDKPDDPNVFHQNTFYYGVDDRFAVGYGDPRTAIKIVDS
jgi:phage major head subunit gpT-like protein